MITIKKNKDLLIFLLLINEQVFNNYRDFYRIVIEMEFLTMFYQQTKHLKCNYRNEHLPLVRVVSIETYITIE